MGFMGSVAIAIGSWLPYSHPVAAVVCREAAERAGPAKKKKKKKQEAEEDEHDIPAVRCNCCATCSSCGNSFRHMQLQVVGLW